MDVVIGNLAHVDMLAEITIGGVRGTIAYCLCVGKISIGALSSGCASEDAYLKLTACLVLGEGDFGQLFRYGLCGSRRSESAKGDVLSVFDQCCSFCSCHTCICHNVFCC